jgi:GNAT superfamily N-acetyltransferase
MTGLPRDSRTSDVVIKTLTGSEITASLDRLAQLRISVFREYPYLYEGDMAFELRYMREFATAPEAVLVAAFDGAELVGAATASPMWAQKPEIRGPFEDRGIDTSSLFYFGESVLLPQYRGRGIGHRFFDHREEWAARCGAQAACFAAVIRPANDPLRPADYRPLDAFWAKRGYAPVSGLKCAISWKAVGEQEERAKQLQYWMRRF